MGAALALESTTICRSPSLSYQSRKLTGKNSRVRYLYIKTIPYENFQTRIACKTFRLEDYWVTFAGWRAVLRFARRSGIRGSRVSGFFQNKGICRTPIRLVFLLQGQCFVDVTYSCNEPMYPAAMNPLTPTLSLGFCPVT